MKIAFVGKGGSGKSTVSSFFVRHLISRHQTVLAVDADINQHFSALIDAPFDGEKAVSRSKNKRPIREHLIGDNPRIDSAARMIKTSPPASGSNVVKLNDDDELLKGYATTFANGGYFMHVGTYESDAIGASCYHSSLSVFENILSHTQANLEDEWVVVDMVAGTDAFSGPLHAMFDAIFLVVEPTVESIGVYRQFYELATSAGVESRVHIIANKIDDVDDVDYIEQETGQKVTAQIPYDNTLRKARRDGIKLQLSDDTIQAMEDIALCSRDNALEPDTHLRTLHGLHEMFASQQFAIDKYGDTLGHIDPEFSFHSKESAK